MLPIHQNEPMRRREQLPRPQVAQFQTLAVRQVAPQQTRLGGKTSLVDLDRSHKSARVVVKDCDRLVGRKSVASERDLQGAQHPLRSGWHVGIVEPKKEELRSWRSRARIKDLDEAETRDWILIHLHKCNLASCFSHSSASSRKTSGPRATQGMGFSKR